MRNRHILPFALALGVLTARSPAMAGQTGETHLTTSADVRSALAAGRAAMNAHPHSAQAHIALAYTLMDAAMADQAIEEGRLATVAEPKSAFAFSAYAWLLRHNAVGKDYGRGYDYEGSLDAYRHAIELDPANLDTRQSLSDNLRYDRNGVEYGPGANLDESIQALEYVQAHQRLMQPDVVNNLAIALLYKSRFAEVLKEEEAYPGTPTLDGTTLAALAALKGSAEAIREADHLTGDTQRRNDALDRAAEGLWNLRRYQEAADLLAAEGSHDAATLGKIELFRTLKPYAAAKYDAEDPRRPLEQMLVQVFAGTLTLESVRELCAPAAYGTGAEQQKVLTELGTLTGAVNALQQQTGLSPAVVTDIAMDRLELHVQAGTPAGLAIVKINAFGKTTQRAILVEDAGRYRIVSLSRDGASLGAEALALLHAGHAETAASLLDLASTARTQTADDPLAMQAFALVWNMSSPRDADAITLAATLLLPPASATPASQAMLRTRLAQAEGEPRTGLVLALAQADLTLKDKHAATTDTETLLMLYPTSRTALRLRGRAYALNADWPGWKTMLASQLKSSNLNELELLREQSVEHTYEGDFAAARATEQTILDQGLATTADFNQFAWLSLFAQTYDERANHQARQAALTANPGFSALHTLGCLEAAEGRAADARQTFERAMIAGHLAEPNQAMWLAYGLLYESYGERTAAIKAFHRVLEDGSADEPTSSGALARRHLQALGA